MNEKASPMNCAQFGEILHDLDRPEVMDMALFESAMDHAEYCTRCADLLEESESLSLSLRALAAGDAGREAPAGIENTLLEALREHKNARKGRMVHYRVVALGIAASMLLVLGFALHQRMVSVPSPSPKAAATAALPHAVATDSSASQSPQQIYGSDQNDSEYATNFVALPYADDPATIEDGAIVRVTLPRSALASFGLPVVDDGTTDQIPADLIVSADGTPEAIRLVSQASANEDF
jgi:hypothetical protein